MILNSIKTSLLCILFFLVSACERQHKPLTHVDVVLIGGGIMSATLGALLEEIDHDLTIEMYEKLPQVALESSAAWNNAGTGHASYCELNYTPEENGVVDIKKAVSINEAFEISQQFWAYLVKQNHLPNPKTFINSVPHMSFVWGDDNIAFLKKRFDAMVAHPFFFGMEYSDNKEVISTWAPLIIKGRDTNQKVAATRMKLGVDVDFGALTRGLVDYLSMSKNFKLSVNHDVTGISRGEDKRWIVVVKDLKTNETKEVSARFVFIGAGGGSLKLLQKSGIPEAKGFGGFPVGGAWLATENQELANQHLAKVYGKAPVGSPPMSTPHLDTRFINGKRALLFGPFATYSTKFLKEGSYFDWPLSISFGNAIPMLVAGVKNLDLVGYLIGQVMMSKEKRLEALREYFPEARLEDWREEVAGQRVQVIKADPDKGGVLQFGTELVSAEDGSLVALLGASPGASIAVKVMLDVLKVSFADKIETLSWETELKKMIPSYGQKLADNPLLLLEIRKKNREILQLEPTL